MFNLHVIIVILLPLINPNTVKPVLNEPFIKGNFGLKRNIFRFHDYHSIPCLNGTWLRKKNVLEP
jgi:hypothetical protein